MNASTQRNSSNASRGDSPESSHDKQSQQTGDRVETNVSELVLCAHCELALARVEGPLDVRSAFEHARAARRWAYRAGAASRIGARLPFAFEDSPTLTGAWHSGQAARARPVTRLSLVVS